MSFWLNKKVLVTGHTGFKGVWLSELLLAHGATVYGLALPPEGEIALFDQVQLQARVAHNLIDLRDQRRVTNLVNEVSPDVVFHLGAQALVRRAYQQPAETWSINVMGTCHLLQALLSLGYPVPVVVVTTDKVYRNNEWPYGYRETDELGGHDPYSASKSAVELLVDSYRKSFPGLQLATARSGNVIGGGDWADDRLLPDLVRAFSHGKPLHVRNPRATRPFQHVLEPLTGYMTLVERLASGALDWQTAYNFGPESHDIRSVEQVVEKASSIWPGTWVNSSDVDAPHETSQLALSIDRSRSELGWRPRWGFDRALMETINWYYSVDRGADPLSVLRSQISAYELAN